MDEIEPRGAIIAFTDGACINNPGPGGWAAAIRFYDDEGRVLNEITLTGGVELSTNNKMEMTAAIEALKATPEGSRVEIVSDSRYVVDGMTEWLPKWIARGWKTRDRKPVSNVELWHELVALADRRKVAWRWVKGHSGDPDNELVDGLAEAEARRFAAKLNEDWSEPLVGAN